MVKSKADFQRSFVSYHLDQTHLVCELLKKGVFDYGEIEGWHENEHGDYPDIYQWKVFPRFLPCYYDQLIEAEVPVLSNDFETWVGITSYGSPYDLYVYPELIRIIFGDRADPKYQKTA